LGVEVRIARLRAGAGAAGGEGEGQEPSVHGTSLRGAAQPSALRWHRSPFVDLRSALRVTTWRETPGPTAAGRGSPPPPPAPRPTWRPRAPDPTEWPASARATGGTRRPPRGRSRHRSATATPPAPR